MRSKIKENKDRIYQEAPNKGKGTQWASDSVFKFSFLISIFTLFFIFIHPDVSKPAAFRLNQRLAGVYAHG